MKKFSMFFKRTVFVVLPALLACSLSVGHLHDVKPVSAEGTTLDESEYDVENEMYTIRKTGDHSLELLFNANPRVYKNFRKKHLDELKDSLKEILKDIVHTKITELSEVETDVDTSSVDGKGGQEGHPVQAYTGPIEPGNPQMVYEENTYRTLSVYQEMILDYTQTDGGGHELAQVTEQVVTGYAYYYVQEYITRNGLENTSEIRANVLNDFCTLLAFRTYSPFNATINQTYAQFHFAGEQIISDSFQINLNHISAMLLLVQDDPTKTHETGVRDLLATIGGASAKNAILDVVNNASKGEIKNFFANCPTKVIQAILREIDFTGTDLNDMMENIGVSTFIEIAGDIGVEKTREIIQYVNEFDKTDFIEKVTELTKAKDVWNAIKNIHIDEILIMKEKVFQWDGIVELLGKTASLDKLRNLEDDKWRHNFHVVLDTAVEAVTIDVNFGFKGNCKYLRKLAGILDDHVKISEVDGRYVVTIDMPNFLANMYRYVIESDIFNDDLKHELFDLAFSTVEEAYEHVHAKTIYDLEENAAQIDYHRLAESIISADEIKKFFGISGFVTQERVDKFVDLLFKAINKGAELDIEKVYELVDKFYKIPDDMKDKINQIYEKAQKLLKKIADRNYNAQDIHDLLSEYTSEEFNNRVNDKIDEYLENAKVTSYYNRFQRLLEKLYAHVPERYRQKSLMDYYVGDSVWAGSGDFTFNITKLVRKIPKIGPKIADLLSAFFDKLPESLSFDLTFTGHDLYRISYHVGGEVKTGALPIDVEAPFFANRETVYECGQLHNIVGWAEQLSDASYEYLYLMPAHDVDAYPIWFTTSADVSKTYDGLESTIEVTPNIEMNHQYSFVWYKDGVLLTDQTESSITVKNHKDSGTYYCVVDGVKQEEIVVTIDQVVVDFPTQTEEMIYDGIEHDYYTSFGATSEDELAFHGTGDVKESMPGDYVVDIELNDPENYVWSAPNDGQYHWSIGKQVIIVHQENIIWDYQGPFTYNGQTQGVHLVESELPAGVHAEYTNNEKTDAGTYKAVVHIVADNPETTELKGIDFSDLNWEIEKAVITIPAEMSLVQDKFEYTGQEISVSIKEDLLPAEITGVNYSKTRSATEVGQYTVKVSYSYDHTNYRLDPNYQKEFNWEITLHRIDVSNVTWDYTNPFTYDGNSHKVSVIDVPTGVKVEYTGTTSAKDPGTYIAYARLYTSSGNELIYNGEIRETVELTLVWKIAEGAPVPTRSEFYSVEQNEAGTSLVWVSLSSGIKGDYTLHAEATDASKYDFSKIVKTGTVDVAVLYDINLFNADGSLAHINVDADGKIIDPNFKFTVRILVPDTYKDHELVLAYVNEAGEVSRLEGQRDGNYMVFTTNHLSIYGLVETHVAGSNPAPYLIVAAAATLAVQATTAWLLIVLAKRKKRTVK